MARFFQKVNMECETVASKNRTGIYLVGATPTAIGAGAIGVITGLATDTTVYGVGHKDFNKLTFAYEATPTAGVSVYIADPVKISDGTINGNVYRIGAKTVGLSASAGEYIAWRKAEVGDQFLLGADNFASAPTVGQYANRTNASVDYTPNASVGTGFSIAIDKTYKLTEGLDATTTVYLVRVVQL